MREPAVVASCDEGTSADPERRTSWRGVVEVERRQIGPSRVRIDAAFAAQLKLLTGVGDERRRGSERAPGRRLDPFRAAGPEARDLFDNFCAIVAAQVEREIRLLQAEVGMAAGRDAARENYRPHRDGLGREAHPRALVASGAEWAARGPRIDVTEAISVETEDVGIA